MKAAAGWNIERARDIALEHGGTVPSLGYQARHCLQQALGIGMLRPLKDRRSGGELDNAPEIHDRHPIGHVAYDRQLMRYQEHA